MTKFIKIDGKYINLRLVTNFYYDGEYTVVCFVCGTDYEMFRGDVTPDILNALDDYGCI